MATFVEIHHKRRKVILNVDQICAIEEGDPGGDLLVRCSNAEDYLLANQEAETILAALKSLKHCERSNGTVEKIEN
jgi:hypothetical protein